MLKCNLTLILCLNIAVLLQITGSAGSKRELLIDPRIINGTDASLHATRHQVSIRRRSDDSISFGSGHTCGGSLISENVVLSAAHCIVDGSPSGTFQPDNNFIVVMGNLDRFEYNNNTLVFDILKIVKRDNFFNTTTLDDDIVLIMLNGSVPAKHPTVKPIILNDGPLMNNTVCQATGWGITEENKLSRMLKTVDLPIVDTNDCRRNTLYGSRIRDGMLCAGYLKGERDTCRSDSGGPLVCRGIQTGIISWGDGCASPLRPGVYSDVAFFKNWILKEVAHHNGTLPKFAHVPAGLQA